MKVCARCSQELPMSDFAIRAASKDGLQTWCRRCNSSWATEHRPRKMQVAPPVQPGMKWCRRCGRTKVESSFASNRRRPDGLQSYCRACQAEDYRTKQIAASRVVKPGDIPDEHKFCRGCQQVKPLSEFTGPTGTRARVTFQCKDCSRRRGREWHLVQTYGITPDDVDALLDGQSGLCGICRTAPAVHVDHDHATGKVRGMLCFRCNAALGQFDDKPENLVRAARYLAAAGAEHSPVELSWSAHIFEVACHCAS